MILKGILFLKQEHLDSMKKGSMYGYSTTLTYDKEADRVKMLVKPHAISDDEGYIEIVFSDDE